ncbi:uncharacterized protein [Antedon mediterranea]|uniref:uncharacterized protein n=1 Tax=Antedon mediterranea TaxID=105859 RepID=UPI003AF4B20A
MPACVVSNCREYEKARLDGIPFHTFPNDKALARRWLTVIRNANLNPGCKPSTYRTLRVCGKHFMKSDYLPDPKHDLAPHLYKPKHRLKPDAVPSIFAFNKPSSTTMRSAFKKRQEAGNQESFFTGSESSHTSHDVQEKKSVHGNDEDLNVSFSSSHGNELMGWIPEEDSSSSSEEEIEVVDDNVTGKVIVNVDSVLEMFKRCQECGQKIISTNVLYRGAKIIVHWQCTEYHFGKWESCPDVRGMAEINLLTASAILYSGNTYQAINNFAKILDMHFLSSSSFYQIQKCYLLPVINEAYKEQQDVMIAELILRSLDNETISILGDARSDSPGYSAKYSTYSFIEEKSDKIVDARLIQVTECSSSVAMEKEGFIRSLEFLLGHGINIKTITTDRSPSIRKVMKDEYWEISHQLDCWHVCKGIKKKVLASGKKKGNEHLLLWTKSITNHLWFCCATCKGDVQVLKNRWKSILNHVVNVHRWEEDGIENTCAHSALTEEEAESKIWLEYDSPAYDALKKIVLDKRLDNDLGQLGEFKHTGTLESYHASYTKFAPKRIHFHYGSMQGRTQLAVIDHNANVGRKQAQTIAGDLRYKMVCPKRGDGSWSAKKIYEAKKYDYVVDLVEKTLQRRMDPGIRYRYTESAVPLPELPKNISKQEQPSKDLLINEYCQRTEQIMDNQ